MIQPKGRLFHEDALAIRWYDRETGKTQSKAKGIPKDCPLTVSQRRTYVHKGTVPAVGQIMEENSLTLEEAWKLLDRSRGPVQRFGNRVSL